MQDRPDAPELLGALALYLFEDLLPHVPREQRFNVRVAANCCAILAREAGAGERGRHEEAKRLARLLRRDASAEDRATLRELQAELSAAIRAGDLDDRWEEAVAILRESVQAKLAVAHPGYEDVADDGR
jgi:Domain of unknown function (DUF6285)